MVEYFPLNFGYSFLNYFVENINLHSFFNDPINGIIIKIFLIHSILKITTKNQNFDLNYLYVVY